MCFGNVKLLSTVTSRGFLELLSFTEFEWKYDKNKCLYNLKCDALRNLVPFVQFKKREKKIKINGGVLILVKLQASAMHHRYYYNWSTI